jgi:hypothetical protein
MDTPKEFLAFVVEANQILTIIVYDGTVLLGGTAYPSDPQRPADECFELVVVLLLHLVNFGTERNSPSIKDHLHHHTDFDAFEDGLAPCIFNNL